MTNELAQSPTRSEVLAFLAAHAVELRSRYGVRRIGLFGSFVRDSAGADSDIDILVDFDAPSFDHYMDLKFLLEETFGREVDLVIARTLKPRIRPLVEAEVVYAA